MPYPTDSIAWCINFAESLEMRLQAHQQLMDIKTRMEINQATIPELHKRIDELEKRNRELLVQIGGLNADVAHLLVWPNYDNPYRKPVQNKPNIIIKAD